MTNSMKCPFCGSELQTHTMTPGRTLICVNKGCPVDSVVMKRVVWQALIDGKKAQDALKVARNLYQELALAHCEMVDDYRTTYGCIKTPEQEAQEYMKEYDEKITSITKQEK